MPKCRVCGRFFKTSNGFKAHLSMVRRTGKHWPQASNGARRGYSSYRRRY